MEGDVQKAPRSSISKIIIGVVIVFAIVASAVVTIDLLGIYSFQNVVGRLPFVESERVVVRSDIPEVTFEVADEERLNVYLEEYGFFEENNVAVVGQQEKVTVERVVIRLVPDAQDIQPVTGLENETIVSVGQNYDPGTRTMEILYQVAPSYSEPREDEYMGLAVSSGIIGFLYRITTEEDLGSGDEYTSRVAEVGNQAVEEGTIFTFSRR